MTGIDDGAKVPAEENTKKLSIGCHTSSEHKDIIVTIKCMRNENQDSVYRYPP